MEFKYRVLVVLSLVAVFSLMPSIIASMVYKNNSEWNDDAGMTECNIQNYSIVKAECPSFDSGNKKRNDKEGCFNGCITVNYLQNHTKNITVTYGLYEQVESYLNNNYVLNSNISCWYQQSNINDLELSLRNTSGALVALVIFSGAGCIAIIIWIFLEIYYWCNDKKRANYTSF